MRDILAIIPAYRNPAQLARCRAHLAAQSVSDRIDTFVRDNSDDNVLFTAAINEGLRRGLARGAIRHFLLLNQDCYLEPGAVEALLHAMDADSRNGICAPLQLDAADPSRVVWGGSYHAFPNGSHIVGSLDRFAAPVDTAWANGAAMLIRRETVEDAGLFDANMRMVSSDADYSFTVRARGWKVRVVPAARCLHESGASRPGAASAEIEAVKAHDIAYFGDKWITGLLYRRLAADGAEMDLAALRAERDKYPR